MIETRDPSALSKSLLHLGRAIATSGRSGALHIGENFSICSFPEVLQSIAGSSVLIAHLQAHLPRTAFPTLLSMDATGDFTITLGGIDCPSSREEAISTAIRDLEAIEALRRFLPPGDETSYSLKRGYSVGRGRPIPAVWGRSPIEAMVKHAASLRPGFHRDPASTLAVDPHVEGRIEMRGLHDWRPHDVDGLMTEARSSIERAFPELGERPDGP
jgi:hypothetical protein